MCYSLTALILTSNNRYINNVYVDTLPHCNKKLNQKPSSYFFLACGLFCVPASWAAAGRCGVVAWGVALAALGAGDTASAFLDGAASCESGAISHGRGQGQGHHLSESCQVPCFLRPYPSSPGQIEGSPWPDSSQLPSRWLRIRASPAYCCCPH